MIFLIGLPGNDQNKIGNELANDLNFVFVDLEKVFVSIYKTSIIESYNLYGIQKLYTMIKLLITSYLQLSEDSEDLIISTIQGLPLTQDFIDFIKNKGKIWYLENKQWSKNIKSNYKDYLFFKDITDNEYKEACKYIEKEFGKKCIDIKDYILIK